MKKMSDKNIHKLIKSAFKSAEKKLNNSGIDYTNSGTCAIGILIKENTCFIVNLGDSRAVMYRT